MKMGTRHCISRLMPHMSTSTTVRKRNLVKINGLKRNAKRSATKVMVVITNVIRTNNVRRIVITHATNVAIENSFCF